MAKTFWNIMEIVASVLHVSMMVVVCYACIIWPNICNVAILACYVVTSYLLAIADQCLSSEADGIEETNQRAISEERA